MRRKVKKAWWTCLRICPGPGLCELVSRAVQQRAWARAPGNWLRLPGVWVLAEDQARSLPDGLFSNNSRPGYGHLHSPPGPSGCEERHQPFSRLMGTLTTSLLSSYFQPPFAHKDWALAPIPATPSGSLTVVPATAPGPELGKKSGSKAGGQRKKGGKGRRETNRGPGIWCCGRT